ncbi:MAG: hypothetical protein AB7P23_13780 [Amphiplicatus sp.]
MALFLVGAVFLVAALAGAYFFWARRIEGEIAEGARLEWARLEAQDPALLDGLDREKFERIYARVHFPRFPGYALAAFAAFLVSLPVTFALLGGGLWLAGAFGLLPAPVEFADRFLIEGEHMRFMTAAPSEAALYYVRDLGGFYYFFGVLFAWLAIVAFFTRRYYARRPGYLRDEILRAR